MSIASEISVLQQDQIGITNALTDKGVVVPLGSGFDDFEGLIRDGVYNVSNTSIDLTKTQTSISFSTSFEPKFVVLTCNNLWYRTLTGGQIDPNCIKAILPQTIDGKNVRQIMYVMFCKPGFLFNTSSFNYFYSVALQTSNDAIYQPTTWDGFTITQTAEGYTVSISRADQQNQVWRFAGQQSDPQSGLVTVKYYVVALG